MAKLTEMDATVENLVVLAQTLDHRMETNEREVAVFPSDATFADWGRTFARWWNGW
jgi:hypothetical protein